MARAQVASRSSSLVAGFTANIYWLQAPGAEMLLVSSVTAPLGATAPASALPCSVAPVTSVMDVLASIFPSITQPAPIVAELPTCQKTLEDCAPLIRITLQVGVVKVRVDAGICKIQTAFASPLASSVRFPPVISNEVAADV